MANRLNNKVAIITGAARGIGAKSAEFFAQEGASVAIWDINTERATEVIEKIQSNGGRGIFCQCDVTKSQEIEKAVDKTVSQLGFPNILFNNAGIAVVGELEEISPEDWDRQYNVNVKSIYLVSRSVIPAMRQVGGGSIINMGSDRPTLGSPCIQLIPPLRQLLFILLAVWLFVMLRTTSV